MHDNDRDADLDEAIDATARALTDGGPRPALRAGVATRIAERHGSAWRVVWPVGIAAAAVLIAMVLLWPERVDLPAVDAPVIATGVRPAPAGVRSDVPSRSDPMTPTSAEPIVVESLAMTPLDLDEIEIPLLTVEALTIEPLSVQ